jgi:hypothetical protein
MSGKKPWWTFAASAEKDDVQDDVEVPTVVADAEAAKEAPPAAPSHPVLIAALAAGVTTSADFSDLLATSRLARTDLQADCVKQAVRCFGQESGPAKAKDVERLSYSEAQILRNIWRDTADAKFEQTEEKPSVQQTGPVKQGIDADDPRLTTIATIDTAEIYENRRSQTAASNR